MPKKAIDTDAAPKPVGPYSQGIVANGFLYTAGFGPQNPISGAMAEDVGGQTRQVLKNIQAVLVAHGASMNDIVKSTVHLQNLDRDFADFNEAYGEFFSEPFPVRTTVGSTLAGILVEIDVVVALAS